LLLRKPLEVRNESKLRLTLLFFWRPTTRVVG
jgi:hypothetical protein